MQTFHQWVVDMGAKLPEKYLKLADESAVKPNEQVVGKLSPEMSRMWGVAQQLADMAREQATLGNIELGAARIAGTLTQEMITATQQKIDTILLRARAVKDLFWASARHEFDLFGAGDIGIRDELTLVKVPPEEEPANELGGSIVIISGLGGNPFGSVPMSGLFGGRRRHD